VAISSCRQSSRVPNQTPLSTSNPDARPNPNRHPPPTRRDLKPANLMIGGGPIEAASDPAARRVLMNELGVLKIADFGLSKSLKLQLQRGGAAGNGMAKPEAPRQGGGDPAFGPPQTSYKMTGETGSYRYMAPGAWRGVGG